MAQEEAFGCLLLVEGVGGGELERGGHRGGDAGACAGLVLGFAFVFIFCLSYAGANESTEDAEVRSCIGGALVGREFRYSKKTKKNPLFLLFAFSLLLYSVIPNIILVLRAP